MNRAYSQNPSDTLRPQFPLITIPTNQEEIADKMDSHMTILSTEKDCIFKLAKIIKADDDDDEEMTPQTVHRNRKQFALKRRNDIRHGTTFCALTIPNNCFRKEKKTRTIVQTISDLPYESIFSFSRKDRKAKTFIGNSNKNAKTNANNNPNGILVTKANNIKPNSIMNKIANEEKKTNDNALKLSLELNTFKNKRYLSHERFNLKGTTDDEVIFKELLNENFEKSYAKKLKASDVLGHSHHLSYIPKLPPNSNRFFLTKAIFEH